MIIDANLYWFDESIFSDSHLASRFLSEIPKVYGINGYMSEKEAIKQIVIEKPSGYQNLNYIQGDYVLEKQLADLDKAGVDKAVLKMPGCQEWMSVDMCRRFNDGMADYCKRSHGRLIPLAVVPPIASKECFDEIDRCRNVLKIQNIQLCAHYGNCYLDEEVFADFFEKLNEQKTTVYIHHVPVPVEHQKLIKYNNLRRSYGRCIDQTTAICREVFSGFFEKYPNLTFVHSMLGGGFFSIYNMIFPDKPKINDQAKRFDSDNENLKEICKKHIYFEMSHAAPWGKDALECAIKVLGADHIIFGSSYPVRYEWLEKGPDFINDLDVSDEDKELILFKNAMKLYDIK